MRSLQNKLTKTSVETREQFEIIIGELIETAESVIDERPLSYVGVSFAVHALRVLTDPTHLMYPKVNKYLLKDPAWNVRRLADYWLGKVTMEMPEEDDSHWKEVIWVLDMLIDGIRTSDDANNLRSRNTFERLLALSASPGANNAVRDGVVQVLYRTMCAGGSTSLVTSCGIVAWLKMQRVNGQIDEGTVDTLARTLLEEMDGEKIDEWGGGLVRDDLVRLQAAA